MGTLLALLVLLIQLLSDCASSMGCIGCTPLVPQGAVELGKGPFWRLPPSLHLRLITSLANDLTDYGAIREALANRVDHAANLMVSDEGFEPTHPVLNSTVHL
jgi:hypothetical protein